MKREQDIIISVNNPKTYFYTNQRCNEAINGISMEIKRGKTPCIAGESGCGKSVTVISIMQLLPKLFCIEEGEIIHHSEDGHGDTHIERPERSGKQMCFLKDHGTATISQDPTIVLNPVYTIGWQICEMIRSHERVTKKEARVRALQLLKDMGIPNPEKRTGQYPHELSGGMCQRVMIVMAMSYKPKVLIVDEPTAASDATTQVQISELIKHLKEEYSIVIMLIIHDMGVVCELADDVAVIHMGNTIESGTAQGVLGSPVHPYTKALLKSTPILGKGVKQEIHPIQGSTSDPHDHLSGCQLAPRCEYAYAVCDGKMPEGVIAEGTHMVRRSRYKEVLIDAR